MNTPTEYCYIVSIFNSYTVHNTFVTIAFCQSNSINIFSIYLSIYVTVTDFGSAVSFGTLCISAPHILAFLTYDVFFSLLFYKDAVILCCSRSAQDQSPRLFLLLPCNCVNNDAKVRRR